MSAKLWHMLRGPTLDLSTVSALSQWGQQSLSDLPFRLIFVANYSIRKSLWQTDENVKLTQKGKGEIAQIRITVGMVDVAVT